MRGLPFWAVAAMLTLAGLAAMIGASFFVIGYLSPFVGRGVYFLLTVVALVLGGLIGVVLRWLAQE